MPVIWISRLALNGATLAWMGLIFYLSSLSQDEASRPLETPAIAWLGALRSYAAHIVLYGVLASLTQAGLWVWKSDYRFRWTLAAAAFSALYGISDEYHQSLTGRSGSLDDIVVNAFGATGGAACLWLVGLNWRRNPKKINRFLPRLPVN